MATIAFFRCGLVCSIIALGCMFIAFASPYWYQSWRRVHNSFGNIGLWHVCLNGFIMPKDPVMKSYVGCWWIHSTEFELVKDHIQPVWFRFIQAFCVFTLLMDLFAAIFAVCYNFEETRVRLYQKRPRMFFIIAFLLLGSAFLVFLIALVFAKKSLDSAWMPRPWMNYLSWSYGLCVLSGFFAAFGGMSFFILALVFKDKEENGDPGVISAAELASKKRALEKQDEAVRQQGGVQMETMSYKAGQYGSGSVASGRPGYYGSGPVQPRPGGAYHGSGQVYPGGQRQPQQQQHQQYAPQQHQQYAPQQHQQPISAISVHQQPPASHHGSGSSVAGPRVAPPTYKPSVNSSYGSGINVNYRPGGQPAAAYQRRDRPSGPPSVAESHDSQAPESAV